MVERSKEFKKMGEELIRKIPDLKWIKECGIKIAWLESDQKKIKGRGIVHAECKKPEEWVQVFCKCDFVIIVYTENCMGMTDNQMRICLWHELLHVGMEEGTAEPKYMINPHDIEDFKEIINRFGLNWSEPGVEPPNIWDVVKSEQANRESQREN